MENKIIRKPGRPKIFTEEELEELRYLYEYELSCLEEIGLILIENITVNSYSYDDVQDLIDSIDENIIKLNWMKLNLY